MPQLSAETSTPGHGEERRRKKTFLIVNALSEFRVILALMFLLSLIDRVQTLHQVPPDDLLRCGLSEGALEEGP